MIRYVTRWALSTGIRRLDGVIHRSNGREYFSALQHHPVVFVRTSEAFETEAEAVRHAYAMAEKKVASLKKQAAKLRDPAWRPKVVEK
jgi:hypothetical protein